MSIIFARAVKQLWCFMKSDCVDDKMLTFETNSRTFDRHDRASNSFGYFNLRNDTTTACFQISADFNMHKLITYAKKGNSYGQRSFIKSLLIPSNPFALREHVWNKFII